MRRNRALWASIVFVVLLVGAATAGLVSGALRPLLGLDLQGGASVILSAPPRTPQEVMERALENIRNRVDAFGVGEPDIALSGTTIEVQIPGSADASIQRRRVDLSCLEDDEGVYGCADDPEVAREALETVEIQGTPSEVCVVYRDEDLECFSSRAQADAYIADLQVGPKSSTTPTPSPTASASPSPAGPAPAPSAFCITEPNGDRIDCLPTQDAAQDARDTIATEVRERTFCLVPTPPEPSPTPSASPSGSASATPSPPASPSPSPSSFLDLDLEGADPLPCEFPSRDEADNALGRITVRPETERFCVVSAAGEQLGCAVRREAAQEQQRQSGQERLLRVIGETARLEERRVLEVVGADDPRPVTCGTEEEQELPRCDPDALADEEVVYPGPSPQGQGFVKYVLGPVVISGDDIRNAAAVLSQQGQLGAVSEWAVTFELDDDGADAFAEATTAAVGSPPPTDQIAIVVDQVVISSPSVINPITGGSGEITGGFSETEAKDLATQLQAGALPVELTRQSVRTVSPTLGEESLQQGIYAGLAGLVLLFLYMLVYYRLLGVVAWLGMMIWAALAVAIVSVAGEQYGYALSLAGVAGLVISLGVTADSYIVFFERLKDEVRSGKSARAAVQPAFARAFKTILAADAVTAIAAIVLYVTAVSSVRGFALTLLVATALDLFVVWFFKRPTVFLVAKNQRLVNMPRFGLSSGVAADVAQEGAGL